MANPHPAITFRVNLELNRTEDFGPNTNQRDVAPLHPDAHQNSPDRGRTEKSNRVNTRSALLHDQVWADDARTSWLSKMNLEHGDEFTLYGQEALDYRKKYVAGDWNDDTPTAGLGTILSIVT
jgi:hypothetical protein